MNRWQLPWSLALRYAGVRGNSGLGRFISRLAMTGFIIGVAILITVLSVMNGFERELRERILSLVPAVTVSHPPMGNWHTLASQLTNLAQVRSAHPFAQTHALLSTGGRTEGSLLYGTDIQRLLGDSPYRPFLKDTLATLPVTDPPLWVGSVLARKLQLQPGDALQVFVSTQASGQGIRARRFVVAGVIDSGTELDTSLAVTSVDAVSALKFGEIGLVDGLQLDIDDILQAPAVAFRVYYQLQGRYAVSDWTDTHGNLYEAIHISKRLVTLVLLALVFVAGFNVISGLFLLVTEKQSDIAMLKTMGLPAGHLLATFALQGTLVGTIGVLIGVALGVLMSLTVPSVVALLEHVLGRQFLSSEIYPVSFLPSELRWVDVLAVAGLSLLVSALASVYPAWQASRVMPAEILRQD